MAGAAVHHAHPMTAHRAMAAGPVAVFSATVAVAGFIGPDTGASHGQHESSGHDECRQSLRLLLHAILLRLNVLRFLVMSRHYRIYKPPSPFSPLNRN